MRSVFLVKVIPLSVLVLYMVFFFSTILLVPFHPDETTQIYMSQDVDVLLTAPGNLFYRAETTLSPEQRYRLIDAPLPRTIIGISRGIFHLQPIESDWNWSLSWEENKANGALPTINLLLLARLSLAIFVPLGLVFFYLILKGIVNWPISLFVTAVLGMNAIFFVHTRRAMAEGVSFCFYFTVLFLIIRKPNKAFLIGLLAGLAFQAKQTTLPILLVPIIVWIISGINNHKYQSIIWKVLIYSGAIFLTYYILNPIAWKDPFHVALLQIQNRLAFSQVQAVEYLALTSPLAVTTLPSRIAAWLANSFFAAPAFFDIGNYSQELSQGIVIYSSNNLHRLFSGWYYGVVTLFIGLFGLLVSVLKIKSVDISINRTFYILIIISILQTTFSVFMLPITFQRYYLLNLALSMLWVGFGLFYLYSSIRKLNK